MIVNREVAALMVELAASVEEIIARHNDSSVGDLQYSGPFSVCVYGGADGLVAKFYEDGIDFYPQEEK